MQIAFRPHAGLALCALIGALRAAQAQAAP